MNIEDTSTTRKGYEWSLYVGKDCLYTAPTYDDLLNKAHDGGFDLSKPTFIVIEHLKG